MAAGTRREGGNGSRFAQALTPETLAAFEAWRRLRNAGATPDLFQMMPDCLPTSVLPRVLLYRWEGGDQWRCRLAGDEMSLILAGSAKGKTLDELNTGSEQSVRHQQFRHMREAGLPIWYVGPLQLDTRGHIILGRLALPCLGNDGAAYVLVLYTYLGDPAPLRGPRHESGLGPTQAVLCTEADLAD
jgi:hypothetical protein